MIKSFIYTDEVGIIFLQEFVAECFDNFPIHKISTEQRGTAVVTRGSLSVTEMEKLRTGRGVPCHYRNTLFVNLYADDGNAHRRDGDHFFNTELVCLLWHAPQNFIVGGNFTCVLSPL